MWTTQHIMQEIMAPNNLVGLEVDVGLNVVLGVDSVVDLVVVLIGGLLDDLSFLLGAEVTRSELT